MEPHDRRKALTVIWGTHREADSREVFASELVDDLTTSLTKMVLWKMMLYVVA